MGNATVRQHKPGDQIRFSFRTGTRRLKKLFSGDKLPRQERDRLLVIADDEGPFWVEGYGAAWRVAVGETTARAVLLTVRCEGEVPDGTV